MVTNCSKEGSEGCEEHQLPDEILSEDVLRPTGAEDPVQREPSMYFRWLVLFATCLVMTCVYYSLDIPAALHQNLKNYMNDSAFELRFNLLYTLYSFPNVILPFFGGYFTDKMGASYCLMIFAAFCFLGQLIFAAGTAYRNWTFMLLGRAVYGIGGESICVAYSTLLTEWFAGKELAFSFGIALAISRLGSVFNNLASPVIANSFSTPWALWAGVALNFMAVVVAAGIKNVDAQQRSISLAMDASDNPSDLAQPLLLQQIEHEGTNRGGQRPVSRMGFRQFSPMFWLLSASCLTVYACILPWNNVASGILLERDLFQAPPAECHLTFPDQCSAGNLLNFSNPAIDANGNTCSGSNFAPVLPSSLNVSGMDGKPDILIDHLSAADVDCDKPFWSEDCVKDYCQALGKASESAGRVMSIPYSISACLSPFLGGVVDRIGHRATITFVASFLLIGVHSTMAFTTFRPAIPLIGQGLAYALYSSVLWPSITLTVPQRSTGVAFGVITSIQNIGLTLVPMAIASIYTSSGHCYIPYVELFFTCCAVSGAMLGIGVNFLDQQTGNKLNGISVQSRAADR
jgi:MFS family permease